MPHPSLNSRLRSITVVVLLTLALAAFPATAQTPSPSLEVGLRFVGGPIWRTSGQPLGLRFQINNRSPITLEGFRIIVGVSDRVRTRSALEAGFTAQPGISASALPFVFEDRVGPETSTSIVIDEPVTSFVTLANATEGGVYPATIALQDATSLAILATLQVPLIYYPEPPETRLNVVPLLPLNERPVRGPDGSFVDGPDGIVPLAGAVGEGGWLTGYLDALEELTAEPEPAADDGRRNRRNRRNRPPPPPDPLQISVAVSPRMLEELVDMSDGFARTAADPVPSSAVAATGAATAVERLADLTTRPAVQSAVMPYSFPDLPTLVEQMPTDSTLEQFSEARAVLQEHLGSAAGRGWLFPPAGRLDAPSLARVQLIQGVADNLFVASTSLEPAEGSEEELLGCPEISQSFTCPISIATSQGRSTGFSSDAGLSTRLANLQLAGDDRLSLQQFFAETSMIREEAPGVEGRVIQATVPSLWHPPPSMARLLLRGLRDAPWLTSLRADEALELAEPVERQLIERSAELAAQPEPSFFAAVQDASRVLDSFETFAPADSPRLARMRQNLLVAQARTLWRDPALTFDYVSGARSEAESEMGKVGLEGAEDFTCTSHDCRLQLVLTNEATYPAEVALQLISAGLDLEDNTIEGIYEPGDHPLTITAGANSSGVFPMEARLETVDGEFVIQEKDIIIRSTNFNRIALVITLGALAFLILFYATRAARRKKTAKTEDR